jgi:hypothetical protein
MVPHLAPEPLASAAVQNIRVQGGYGENLVSIANPSSTMRIFQHPIHPMLVPIPIACFIGVLLSDLTYSRSAEMMRRIFPRGS